MDFQLEQKRIDDSLAEGWQQLASDNYEAALGLAPWSVAPGMWLQRAS